MSAKTAFPTALVLAALAAGPARAQTPPAMPYPQEPPTPAARSLDTYLEPPPPGPAEPPGRLSNWINYTRPWSCCGPLGGDGPVQSEIYVRTGPSFIVGGGVLADTLQTGWVVEGGVRSLYFDADLSAAWVVNLGLSNVSNHGKRPDIHVPLHILVPSAPTPTNPNGGAVPINFGDDVPG